MRIGLDVRDFDAGGPGQQRYLWRLGAWLGDVGHEVHLLTVRDQPAEIEAPSGVELHRWHGMPRGALRRHVRDLELDALLLNPERARRYRGIQPNVLRSGYGTDHYSEKLRSFRREPERAIRRALRITPWVLAERKWERAYYELRRPPPFVIAQSEYMRRRILRTYRVPDEHVRVVHNGVDRAEFSVERRASLRGEQRARWGIPEEALCLLFLGHNFRLKGLWQLLRILPSLTDSGMPVHLLAVGRGTGARQRRRARSLIRRGGLEERVVLTGPVGSSIDTLAAADALLHLSWHDSFGFVALEAMACGLPVVTTRYAGAAELIDHGRSGLLVDPGDDREIAAAVLALTDPELRGQMGDAAAIAAEPYGEERNFAEVARVLELAVRRSPGPVR